MVLVRLVFYTWLAILGGIAWVVNDYALAGKFINNALCMLAFFGGAAGAWLTINAALSDEKSS